MKLIAIVGQKRSGKDTAANVICDEFDTERYQLALPIKWALNEAYNDLGLKKSSGVILSFNDFDGEGIDREQPILISNSDAYNLMYRALKLLQTNGCNLVRALPLLPDGENLFGFDAIAKLCTESNNQPWSIRRMMQVLGTDIVVNHIDREFWNRCMMATYIDCRNKDRDLFLVKDVRQEHELSLMRDLGALIIFVKRDDINKNIDTHITEAGLTPVEGDIIIENNDSIEIFESKIKEVISCQMK
ncbi:gp1 dNMP kinase [Acinetobacter phage Acj9]|uniref:Gp1 dNMP kinase n=1 Tax=Acinetobacter phage Acj9 TaxID=760939 RepID=E5EPT9_9CAUD|nr:gp1 dNMP kinase [Acinetobacter phage Acj9]ADG60055.1 gp1 dNMP kinase [Acinetobacter phage Acj9]